MSISPARVAVIGAGSSGFQLVPAIAGRTGHIDVYQRTPQRWLRFVSWWPLTDAVRDQVMIDPNWDTAGLSCNESNHLLREMFIAWMRSFTDDEQLLAKIIPDYPPMGKRMLQGNETWLKTLQRDDVELITEGIDRITSDGVVTVDGEHRRADVLVWATGFDVNHQLGSLEIRGVDGPGLNDAWGDAAYAYLGITVPGFPNFYCLCRPGTNAVNGTSIVYNSECQMRYVLGCIDMVPTSGAGSGMPRADVCDACNRSNQEKLAAMVYTHPIVASYYRKFPRGRPHAVRVADGRLLVVDQPSGPERLRIAALNMEIK